MHFALAANALLDPALRDGLLDIEIRLLHWKLDILPPRGIPQGGTGYWILSIDFRFDGLTVIQLSCNAVIPLYSVS